MSRFFFKCIFPTVCIGRHSGGICEVYDSVQTWDYCMAEEVSSNFVWMGHQEKSLPVLHACTLDNDALSSDPVPSLVAALPGHHVSLRLACVRLVPSPRALSLLLPSQIQRQETEVETWLVVKVKVAPWLILKEKASVDLEPINNVSKLIPLCSVCTVTFSLWCSMSPH